MSASPLIQTPISEMFDLRYPIICGAMMWLGTPRLCEVVADAGGMGTLTAAIYKTEEEFRDAVVETKKRLNGRSFMVGVTILPSIAVSDEHHKMYLRVCAEEKVPGIEVSGAPIDRACGMDYLDALKEAGVRLFHKVGSLRHAKHAQKVGYDGVYCAGIEEGGHPLNDDVSTMVLTPKFADELSIPVVTTGGIADGRSMAAALALGASGVMMATRFMATTDCCEIHDNIRNELVKRQEYETELIAKNLGLQCRALSNGVVKEINKVEAANGGLDEMMPLMTGQRAKKGWIVGDVDLGVYTVGQTIGRINDIPTTAELLERMAKEALDASMAVQGLYS
ncbi:nitronate monooxygenase [Pseudomaricurvus alkylphenolicus]|uniref:NAD(P)H-dependent flavin oxidoreductase n=1 Tax=Pseudomaricurvus alkylphenolicus TaxID=1306991 RepID=UPI001423758E|nr:nitronate monooxygenase [Pseudomaricurvus alkylphenolicus]NIB38478.1 nitronate monooxygenase [Pseudomaricurvus alkylphenolicus]